MNGSAYRATTSPSIGCRATISESSRRDERSHPASLRLLELRQKARLMLGFKRLAWLGVEQPPILPKPNLAPLTSGYRRFPVLQDGADLRCGTRLIARELERRVPGATLFPERSRGFADAIAWWAEHQFIRPVALFVSGINADHMPAGLHEDRARLHGLPPPSIEACARRPSATSISCAHSSPGFPTCCRTAGRFCWAARPASPLRSLSRGVVLQGPPHRLPPRTEVLPAPACLARPHGRDRPRQADRHRPCQAIAVAREPSPRRRALRSRRR